jgi:hypothetical protein
MEDGIHRTQFPVVAELRKTRKSRRTLLRELAIRARNPEKRDNPEPKAGGNNEQGRKT